jgi:HEAT repeat protein
MSVGKESGGVLTTDRDLVVRSWDGWVARATGIPAEAACGRRLVDLFPEVEERGLASHLRRVAKEGITEVLAPAFHAYFIPCPPREPSVHFSRMQQHVTLAPLRAGEEIVGVVIEIEDVTARRDRERDLASRLRSSDERVRLQAVEALAAADGSSDVLVGAFGDESWRVRSAAVGAVAGQHGEGAVEALTRVLREQHQDLSALNAAVSALTVTGEDVLPPLLGLLESADPDLRIYVALALGQRGDRRAVSGLLRAMEDEDPNVRFHALEALGRLRARAAVPAIAEVVEGRDFSLTFAALDALAAIGDETVTCRILPLLEDDLFRSAALAALGRLGGEEVVAALTALLARDGLDEAGEVAAALWAIHQRYDDGFGDGEVIADLVRATAPPEAGPRTMRSLESASGAERAALVAVLGWIDYPESDGALLRALSQPGARAAAADALVRHGSHAADVLVRGVASLEGDALRAAVLALGRIGNPSAVPALLVLLETTSGSETAVSITSALGAIGDPRAFEPLVFLLDHPKAAVRHAAVGALSSIAHPALRERLAELLASPSPAVREAAVRIVGYFGYEEYADRLLALCDDADESVRRAAVEHAAYLDDPRVPAIVARELRDAPAPTRAAAARALARLEPGAVTDVLADALADPDLWVRYYAARSAASLRIPGLAARFADLAQRDPAVPVRLASLDALAAADPARAVPVLSALLRDEEPDVRAAALAALGRTAHPAAVETLAAVLASGDPGMQRATLESLDRAGAAALADRVADVATSAGDAVVARAAAFALFRAATPEAVRHLRRAAARVPLRDVCVELLARLPEELLDTLGEELRHGPEETREAVLAALAHMTHAGAAPLAATALDDPSPAVRRAAALTLCRHDLRAAGR